RASWRKIRRFFSSDIVIPFRAWGPKISSHNGRKSQGITPESFDVGPPPVRTTHPARSPHPAAKPLRPKRDCGKESGLFLARIKAERRENQRTDRLAQRSCPQTPPRDSIPSPSAEIYGENSGALLLPAFFATVSKKNIAIRL